VSRSRSNWVTKCLAYKSRDFSPSLTTKFLNFLETLLHPDFESCLLFQDTTVVDFACVVQLHLTLSVTVENPDVVLAARKDPVSCSTDIRHRFKAFRHCCTFEFPRNWSFSLKISMISLVNL